jgi:recombination protein RecR
MNLLPKPLQHLIESFEKLPGIGPKSAQRLGFYLLHMPQEELVRFSDQIKNLKLSTVLCDVCKNTTEQSPCSVCNSSNRDNHSLCVVEQPTDVLSIERTGSFQGRYHVLHGCIDPLNNIGPDEIFLSHLVNRLKQITEPTEIILALNPNMEGEATAMYLQKEINHLANSQLFTLTRLAHGLPVGADLEYADEITLRRALEGRRHY